MPSSNRANLPIGRRIAEVFHVLALGVWLGSLVMTGAGAAILFPTMRSLDPALPAYGEYAGEHWALAAGQVAQRLFLASDMIQFGALLVAGGALLTAVKWFGLSVARWSTAARAGLLIILIGTAGYQLLVLGPRMTSTLAEYRAHAKAGRNEEAQRARAAFARDHPVARNVLIVNAVLVGAAMAGAAWSMTAAPGRAPEEEPRPARGSGP